MNPGSPMPAPEAVLRGRRLLLVTGKGGVGKSAVAAALAQAAADQGRRTLLVEMAAHGAMESLLGLQAPLAHEPREVRPRLWACNLDPERAVGDALAGLVPTPRLVKALLGNSVARLFLRTAPAVVETSVHVCLHAWMRDAFDLVVVDLAATGHAMSFLESSGMMATALRTGRVAQAVSEASAALRDPASTAIVLVTLPEELPVNEAVDLYRRSREKLGLVPAVVVVNRVHAPPVAEADLPRLDPLLGAGELGPEAASVREAVQLGVRAHTLDRRQLDRLRAALPEARLLTLPTWRDAGDEPALVGRLAERLRGLLGMGP